MIKELDIEYIETSNRYMRKFFMNEPWNDDWRDEVQLHEYIMDLIGKSETL